MMYNHILLLVVLIAVCAISSTWGLMMDQTVPASIAFYIIVWDHTARNEHLDPTARLNLTKLRALSSPLHHSETLRVAPFSPLAIPQLFVRKNTKIVSVLRPDLVFDSSGGNWGDRLILWWAGDDGKTNQQFDFSDDGSLYCQCGGNRRFAYVKEDLQEVHLEGSKVGEHTFLRVPAMLYFQNPTTDKFISKTGRAEAWNTTTDGRLDTSKQWFLVPATRNIGYFSLVPRDDPSLCLDINGGTNGNEMIMYPRGIEEQNNQIFKIDNETKQIYNDLNDVKERRVIIVDSNDGRLTIRASTKNFENFATWDVHQGNYAGPLKEQFGYPNFGRSSNSSTRSEELHSGHSSSPDHRSPSNDRSNSPNYGSSGSPSYGSRSTEPQGHTGYNGGGPSGYSNHGGGPPNYPTYGGPAHPSYPGYNGPPPGYPNYGGPQGYPSHGSVPPQGYSGPHTGHYGPNDNNRHQPSPQPYYGGPPNPMGAAYPMPPGPYNPMLGTGNRMGPTSGAGPSLSCSHGYPS